MREHHKARRRLARAAPAIVLATVCAAGLMLAGVAHPADARKGANPAAFRFETATASPSTPTAEKGPDMPKLKIDVYEGGERTATITVPTWVVTGAARLLPRVGGKKLEDHVDIAELAELLKNPPAKGVLLEVDDRKGGDRLVISIVGERAEAMAQ